MSLLKIRRMSHTSSISGVESELTRYLNLPALETDNDEPFDLLSWWRSQESRNPILTVMARDILMVSVSTVASEAAFSAGGRLTGCLVAVLCFSGLTGCCVVLLALDSSCKEAVVINIDVQLCTMDLLSLVMSLVGSLVMEMDLVTI
ncbi:hypothetical protein RHSIM_Rhsim01G0169700 [Rhododendron simsii]|uniref:HAT C-terminal dimerisation domain-containing protein n=1 Tax=Rhododendron simsii TaxID=118357 RepID=A0A834HEL1_RHOSS|nr:hypothetical protein RHSIM_Rhsim01G0169700 [Rhododendron simsii]